MYSLVLATLLTSGAETPSFHRLCGPTVSYSSCYGCCGGAVYYAPRCCYTPVYSSCFGCCGGVVYSSGCFGCCGGVVYSSGCYGCGGGYVSSYEPVVYGKGDYVTYGKGGQAPMGKGYTQAPVGKGTQAPMTQAPMGKGTQAPMGKGTQAPAGKGTQAPSAPAMKGQAPKGQAAGKGQSAMAEGNARLLVKAPVDVKIYVNGYLTRRQNESQVFNTPELVAGQTYHYEIVARREGDESAVVIEKKVTVQAGRESVLDLSAEFAPTTVTTASR